MSAKRVHKSKRELLFCVTQPVVDGWLTSSLVLQIDFSHDRSASHAAQLERVSPGEVAMRPLREVREARGETPVLEEEETDDPTWSEEEGQGPEEEESE